MKEQPTVRVISELPGFLSALLWIHPAMDRDILEVQESPTAMHPTDPEYGPIMDYLAGVCYFESDWSRIEDPYMVGEEAKRTQYTVYPTCPGSATTHVCRFERIEAKGVTNGY